MFLSFKVDGRTTRGKHVKSLSSSGEKADAKDIPLSLINNCQSCNNVPTATNIIECQKCKETFHIQCLTFTLPADFLHLHAVNPCLWWCCVECVRNCDISDETTEDA